MILSEETRRWIEIRFYYFCLDLYHIRNDMVDVILMIEAVAQIGQMNLKNIKLIAGKLLNDQYYLPTRDEVVLLGNAHKVKISKLAKFLGISDQAIRRKIKVMPQYIKPMPKLDVAEDQEVYKFLEILDNLRDLGI